MDRRQFMWTGTYPLFSNWMTGTAAGADSGLRGCPEVYSALVSANDEQVPLLLAKQERQSSSRQLGGLSDADGIYTAGAAAGFIRTLAAAFCAPESKHYLSKDLIQPMELAAKFLRSIQHPDGTIDLHTTNFHSPPDTAFVVDPAAVAVAILQRQNHSGLTGLLSLMKSFLLAAGDALATGGLHTPNHRWVVCSALARLHKLGPNEKYLKRIDSWLGEGIDIDADGQFNERSTSVYSPVTDSALTTVARLLDRPALLDPVRRNLEMTFYYLHADGEVATEGSRRQDQYARGSTTGYYLPARYLAIRDRNGRLASFVRSIEAIGCERLAGNLAYFLENPDLRSPLPASEPLPSDFSRFFVGSNLVRIRRKAVSGTILGGNPVLFSFHKGEAALESVRLAAAFFGKGQFVGEKLIWEMNRGILSQSLVAPYYQPLAEKDRRTDGDWGRMDRSLRQQSEVQSLNTRVVVSEENGRFEIEIRMTGCERVPVSVELGFRRRGNLSGVTPHPSIADAFLLSSGYGSYESGGETIEFGPGLSEHRYVQIRGALPKLDALSVYITGFTPFKHNLIIR